MIDSHIHLWSTSVAEAAWLAGDRTARIRRPFAIDDYAVSAAGLGVDAVVVITAEQSVIETEWLVRECANSSLVAGVVGWVDLAGEFDEKSLDALVGIRHSVVSEDEGWLDRAEVRRGIARFARVGRVLELLVSARDLPAVRRCAADHPGLSIVIDHLAAPPTEPAAWSRWRQDVLALRPHANVRFKVSGDGVTGPSVKVALEASGPARLLLGSDWPVSTLRAGLDVEFASLRGMLAALTDAERERIETGTAVETYGLAS